MSVLYVLERLVRRSFGRVERVMKIGIVGYQGSGKSSLFEWLTGEPADPALAHTTQSAMATVRDDRVEALCDIYHPKKVTQAALELIDTPGLSRTHEDSATRLAMIREAGCLVVVVATFAGRDGRTDLQSFEEDLLLADLDIVSRRVERVREQLKKPRTDREALTHELETLEPVQQAMENGQRLATIDLTNEQRRVIRPFQLFSDKPRFVIFNVDEEETEPEKYLRLLPPDQPGEAIAVSLQRELARLDEAERAAFCEEMGVAVADRDELVRRIMDASGQMLFFTVGEKEVRTWLLHKGGTAVEAAECIHTDLARGFIRAEVMKCDDLIRLGSEREVKAQHLMRQEHKDYEVQEGEILLIRHN